MATTPEQFIHNLARAMRNRDKALYETLLDKDFWFAEFDCLGYTVFENDQETELTIIVSSRDGSTEGLFDIFSDFSYDFELIRRLQELGSEYPETYEGDPDGHPDEDWEVFYGRVHSKWPSTVPYFHSYSPVQSSRLRLLILISASSFPRLALYNWTLP